MFIENPIFQYIVYYYTTHRMPTVFLYIGSPYTSILYKTYNRTEVLKNNNNTTFIEIQFKEKIVKKIQHYTNGVYLYSFHCMKNIIILWKWQKKF